MKKICMWSGPRNISTAIMYSFAQRDDTVVIDEPLYGHYLRVTNADHPGRKEVIEQVDCDGNRVMRSILDMKGPKNKILFMKQMSHHLQKMNRDFIFETENIFLIRDPKDVIASLTIQLPHANLRDTGLDLQWRLFKDLRSRNSHAIVIDSKELLNDPKNILSKLCERLSIPYSESMLSWDKGPIQEDGVWAKYWYKSVHDSEGFLPYKAKPLLAEKFLNLLDECQPYYDKLYKYALRKDS